MLEQHISSKYLETLSYNFSIKVIFIFAFIGNRMDLFYFHKNEKKKKQASWENKEERKNPPSNGCFLVLSVSTKQKIKPINVMGISRRFAFIPFLSRLSLPFLRLYLILPCHCAFLLRVDKDRMRGRKANQGKEIVMGKVFFCYTFSSSWLSLTRQKFAYKEQWMRDWNNVFSLLSFYHKTQKMHLQYLPSKWQ